MDRELNKFYLSKFQYHELLETQNYWSHESSTVDVDVVDRVHSTCYISRLKLRSS